MKPFTWGSPLGVGVALFLVTGVVHFLIGVLAPVMMNTEVGRSMILSPRTDAVLFGRPMAELLRDDRALATARTILFSMLAGMLVGAGVLEMALAWFGLRQGQAWAFWTLVVEGVALVPFWVMVLAPYVRAGARPGLGDTPPFMWVPAALLVPAAVLSFIGLSR
jgi:hypothetical protein